MKKREKKVTLAMIHDLREHHYLQRRLIDQAQRSASMANKNIGRLMDDIALLEEKLTKLHFAYLQPGLPFAPPTPPAS